jgi:hypothetical protein
MASEIPASTNINAIDQQNPTYGDSQLSLPMS